MTFGISALTPLTVLAHGGNTAATLELLTGHAIEGFGLSWGKDARLDANIREHLVRRLHLAMTAAQRERRLVWCGDRAAADRRVPSCGCARGR